MRTAFIITCLILLFELAAYANDGAIGSVGGTIAPIEDHPSIRMVREDIHIKTIKDRNGRERIEVNCRFVFHNEGNATTVKMGFPEDFDGNSNGFTYFRSRVDGKPVSVRKVPPGKDEKSLPRYRGWRIKDVHFNKNQTRVVEDTYGGYTGGSIAGDSRVMYILTTGSSWHGTIGEVVVTMDISAFRDYQTIEPHPSGFERHGNKLVWRFRNLEPQENIEVMFWPGYNKFMVNGKKETADFFFTEKAAIPYLEHGMIIAAPEFIIRKLLHERVDYLNNSKVDSQNVTLKIGDKTVSLSAGNKEAVVDGKVVVLPRAPYIRKSQNQSALVAPIAPILRALGASVTYDSKTGTTRIDTPQTQ